MAKQQAKASSPSASAGAQESTGSATTSRDLAGNAAAASLLREAGTDSAFEDVAADHWAASEINAMAAAGTIEGDGNGKFRPNDPVNQAEALKILAGVLNRKVGLAAGEEWFEPYMKLGQSAAALVDNNPARSMTRADVAHAAGALLGLPEAPGFARRFSDLPHTDDAFQPVMAAVDAGLFLGDGAADTIRPGTSVTRAEMAKVASRAPDATRDLVAAEVEALQALDDVEFRALLENLAEEGRVMAMAEALCDTDADAKVEVPVALYRFWSADSDMRDAVNRANEIYAPHGIHVTPVTQRTITEAEAEALLGHDVSSGYQLDTEIDAEGRMGADMASMVSSFGLGDIITGVWLPSVMGDDGLLSGRALRDTDESASPNIVWISGQDDGADTFAHELAHLLAKAGHVVGDDNNLLADGSERDKDAVNAERLTDDQVATIKASPLAFLTT